MKQSLAILLIMAVAGCGNRKKALPSSNGDVEPSASVEAYRMWRHELAIAGYADPNEPLQSLLRKIEQSSFEDAYGLWRQEMSALATNSDGTYYIPGGVTDSKTGEFIPSRIAALQCRLGRDAHLHESFLLKELAADVDVHLILESSHLLCAKYGIHSMATVRFVPQHGYVSQMNSGSSPQVQQAVWLKAMSNTGSQPDSAANGSQPVRSESNSTSSAAGTRR